MLNRCIKVLKFNNTVKQQPKERGFTIIEVVLVLAIAGLIFLMVFIALPALQRNQRDTQRKNDLNRAIAAVQQYQSNNRGQLPTSYSGTLTSNYLEINGDKFEDPSGIKYSFVTWGVNYGASGDGVLTQEDRISNSTGNVNVFVARETKCDGSKPVAVSGENRVSLLMVLEGGGATCVNN